MLGFGAIGFSAPKPPSGTRRRKGILHLKSRRSSAILRRCYTVRPGSGQGEGLPSRVSNSRSPIGGHARCCVHLRTFTSRHPRSMGSRGMMMHLSRGPPRLTITLSEVNRKGVRRRLLFRALGCVYRLWTTDETTTHRGTRTIAW